MARLFLPNYSEFLRLNRRGPQADRFWDCDASVLPPVTGLDNTMINHCLSYAWYEWCEYDLYDNPAASLDRYGYRIISRLCVHTSFPPTFIYCSSPGASGPCVELRHVANLILTFHLNTRQSSFGSQNKHADSMVLRLGGNYRIVRTKLFGHKNLGLSCGYLRRQMEIELTGSNSKISKLCQKHSVIFLFRSCLFPGLE